MMQLTRWRLAARTIVYSLDPAEAKRDFETATEALNSILEARKIKELGDFAGWCQADLKIDVPELLRVTEKAYREKWETTQQRECL